MPSLLYSMLSHRIEGDEIGTPSNRGGSNYIYPNLVSFLLSICLQSPDYLKPGPCFVLHIINHKRNQTGELEPLPKKHSSIKCPKSPDSDSIIIPHISLLSFRVSSFRPNGIRTNGNQSLASSGISVVTHTEPTCDKWRFSVSTDTYKSDKLLVPHFLFIPSL
jgi:hypothetical protein